MNDEKITSGIIEKTKIEFILALLLITLAHPQLVDASPTPQVAQNYYGNVTINGAKAPIGTDVAIFTNNKMCARYVVRIEGRYGIANCNSDSINNTHFEVNGKKAATEHLTTNNVNLALDSRSYALPKGTEIILIIALLLLLIYLILKERKRRI